MIIYFTGTGNSLYIAEAIADRVSDETVSSNDIIKRGEIGNFYSEKPWVFVFPIYLSTIAEVFANFIRGSKFQGSKDAYFVATCAGSMGATPNLAAKLCKEKSLNYRGAVRIPMPQNYIALFKMDSQELCDKKFAEAAPVIEATSVAILSNEDIEAKKVSGIEYVATGLVEKMYNGPFTKTKKFYATDECMSCGLCEKMCPMNNIQIVDGKPKWIGSCIHCMSCINRCPKQAIEYGKNTIGKKRYVCKTYNSGEQ